MVLISLVPRPTGVWSGDGTIHGVQHHEMATSSMLEDQPNSVILRLLQPEFLNGELARISVGGFLERAASLLWKQLGCSQEDVEDDQKKLQYTACILWALFSPPNLQKKYAQLLYEHPAFVHSTFQLNYSLLKARCELNKFCTCPPAIWWEC